MTLLRRAAGAVSLPALLAGLAEAAPAQLVTVQTAPVAQSQQFAIFPSDNLGMGGVSIALPDTLLDPFLNPARAARLRTARILSSPTVYGVSNDAGAGRALPLGAFGHSGAWFGAIWLALQEVDAGQRSVVPQFPGPVLDRPGIAQDAAELGPDPRSHGNAFAFAALGKVVPDAGLTFAGSVSWAGLNAVDGVDLLYTESQRVRQDGQSLDLRLGLVKEWAGDRSLEAVVLHNRFGMTHDVTYLEVFWDPGTQVPQQRPRVEQNRDQTNTWGLHLEYQRPLAASGWRIGWLATANRMSHPESPNYEIMNLPQDPGNSSAFNIGIGLSRTFGAARFGIDAIYEPIWSHTWAAATAPVETLLGDTIPAGGKTVDNHFRFSNALFRMGVSQELGLGGQGRAAGLQLGLMVHSIQYRLEQDDIVQGSHRSRDERWVEWTPTWGLGLRFPELEIRYRGRVTHGTRRPGVEQTDCFECRFADPAGGILPPTPSGGPTLDEVKIVTHQISLSLPLR